MKQKCYECNYFRLCRSVSAMKGSAFCDKCLGLMSWDKNNKWKKFKAFLGR